MSHLLHYSVWKIRFAANKRYLRLIQSETDRCINKLSGRKAVYIYADDGTSKTSYECDCRRKSFAQDLQQELWGFFNRVGGPNVSDRESKRSQDAWCTSAEEDLHEKQNWKSWKAPGLVDYWGDLTVTKAVSDFKWRDLSRGSHQSSRPQDSKSRREGARHTIGSGRHWTILISAGEHFFTIWKFNCEARFWGLFSLTESVEGEGVYSYGFISIIRSPHAIKMTWDSKWIRDVTAMRLFPYLMRNS